jgi:hypothetical protein
MAGRAWTLLLTITVAVTVLSACDDPVGPVVRLELRGAASQGGAPLSAVRVILLDRRSSLEAGVVLARATTDAAGHYELGARAERPGYLPGCDFLVLFIEGFEYSTAASAPVRCVAGVQTIDLAAPAP